MTQHPVALAVILAFSPLALAQSPRALARAEAERAYAANDSARCAEQYLLSSRTATGSQLAALLYSAACCQALGGKPKLALETLGRAHAAGLTDAAQIKNDTDLASVSKTPQFVALVAKIEARDALLEKAQQPALRREILEMLAIDQAARKDLLKGPSVEAIERVEAIDQRHTKRLKQIVAKYGWPGKKLVGASASHGAWLLAQHADLDRPFQREVLALMEAALQKKDVTPIDVAYLTDRVAAAEDKPQRYGTQFVGGAPKPIEDEAHVDERRLALGLETMADYTLQMQSRYGGAPRPPDAGR